MEVVWVSKHGEEIDPDWFAPDQPDVLVVIQGCLKVEFESAAHKDLVLEVGNALVLPPACRCRAHRWPRDSKEAAVLLAAYPAAPYPERRCAGPETGSSGASTDSGCG